MAWETDDSTGLLAHFVGTVQKSVWTTDSQRQDPNKPFLSWLLSVDDILQENFEGTVPEGVTTNISIGNGWTEDEEGNTVEHKDGVTAFKSSSVYGKIIGLVAGKQDTYGSNVVVKDGGPEIEVDLSGVAKYMQANGFDDPRVANIWEGLQFEFRGIGFRYRDTKSDDDVFGNVLPVRLVGENAEVKSGGTVTATKSEPVVRDTVGVWTSNGADEETANTLNDLANASPTHATFRKQALVLPAVKDNADLKAAVMDASVFD